MFGRKAKEIKRLKQDCDKRDFIINSLQEDIKDLQRDYTELNDKLAEAKQIIEKYRALDDATPSDCKRGSWCKGCEFNKEIIEYDLYGRHQLSCFCGKVESCSNFVQKKD